MSKTHYAQFCALARAAEIVGERWTLLIVRELLLGQKRFGDLAARLNGVSPTVLTERLNALIEAGVIARTTLPAPFNAQVYELTPIGRDLKPAIRALIRWGGHFLFPMRDDDAFEPDWVLLGLEAVTRQTPSPAHKLVLKIRHKTKAASFLVEGGARGTTIERGDGPGNAQIESRFDTVLQMLARGITLDEAVAKRLAKVEGSLAAARTLPKMFDLAER